ncbi:MAG TPA: hypothetical protein VLL97_09220, partial [Acidobacteriota bacterium]|nr:hypothetical protein [Acidobacteriota bacterium]
MAFSKKTQWGLLILYMAIAGSYVGLEVDTFIGDLPFFQAHSFLLIFNVLFILLIPPFVYAVFASAPSLRKIRQNRAVRNGVLIFTTLYFHFMVLLALYKSIRRMDFDFYFFWYNATFAPTVLWKLYAPGLIIVAVSMTVFFFLQKQTFAPVARMLQRSSKTFGVILAALIISGILCQIMTIHSVRGSLAGFVWAGFLSDRRLRTEYGGFYENHLDKLQSGLPLDVA